MSVEFDWQLDVGDEWRAPSPPPPRAGLILVILVAANGAVVGRFFQGVRQGQESLKHDLELIANLEARTLRDGDRATYLWLQDGYDTTWYTRQKERFPAWGSEARLEPGQAGDMAVLKAALAPGGEAAAWAEVAWETQDGVYRRAQFYRQQDGRWVRTGALASAGRTDGAPTPEEQVNLGALLVYLLTVREAGGVAATHQPYLTLEFINWELRRLGLADEGAPPTPVLDLAMDAYGLAKVRALLAALDQTNSEGEALRLALNLGLDDLDEAFVDYLAAKLGIESQMMAWAAAEMTGAHLPVTGPSGFWDIAGRSCRGVAFGNVRCLQRLETGILPDSVALGAPAGGGGANWMTRPYGPRYRIPTPMAVLTRRARWGGSNSSVG